MFDKSKLVKLVKLRGVSDSRRFGLAARSLKELIRKGCDFLKVPVSGARVCLSSDGTLVTEGGFETLPEHCELVLLGPGQSWRGVLSDLEQLLSSELQEPLVEAVRTLLSEPLSPQRQKLLTDMKRTLEDTSEKETRDQDQDWFTGLDSRFKTKSSYMRFNCESRVRSYMKEVSKASRTLEKPQTKVQFEKTLQTLGQMLKSARYHGSYFDRSNEEEGEGARLCTAQGWFTCQGSFDEDMCPRLHSINPYSSRESRVIFSTWNLDHRIEKKRSIIPALLQCHQNRPSSDINLTYFYRLLFTTDNLKLVHIACHKKGAHDLECDAKKVYTQTSKTRKTNKFSKTSKPSKTSKQQGKGKEQRGKRRCLR